MPLYIYASEKPDYSHEINQLLKIVEDLDEIYKTSEEYCYIFFNVKYSNKDKLRQYDALIFTEKSISIIELKSIAGKFSISQEDDKSQCSIFQIKTKDKIFNLKWNQIYHQHSYLTNYFGKTFKQLRNKNKDHYRIDNYIVFNDPLIIENSKLHKTVNHWLSITTIGNFKKEFLKNQKEQPFSLTEKDLSFLGKAVFKLHLRKKEDIFKRLKPPLKQFNDMLTFFDDKYINDTLTSLIDEFYNKYFDATEYLLNWKENQEPFKIQISNKIELHQELDEINIKDLDNKILKLLDDRFSFQLVQMNDDILGAYNDPDNLFFNSFEEIYKNYQMKLNQITLFRDGFLFDIRNRTANDELHYNRLVILNFLNVFFALKYDEI